MKYFTFLLTASLILILSLTTQAQRLKDKPVQIRFIDLPLRQLPADYKTYSITTGGSAFDQAGSSTQAFSKSIVMDGFKRLDGQGENSGHLRVQVYGGRVYVGQLNSKSNKKVKKDKDGKETTYYTYNYEVPLTCNTNYKIFNPAGEVIMNGSYANDATVKTGEYKSSKARSSSRGRDIESLQRKHAKNAVSNIKSQVHYGLIDLYDYDKDRDRYNLYLIKKHASEAQWLKHYEKVKEVFEKASHTISSAELKESLTPAMEFYGQHASKNPKGDKKLKRIYKAANYNLALLHYSVDEFSMAKEYADKVIASEKKDRRSRLLNEKMDKWKKKMDKLDIHSIHYARDLSDAMPPAQIAALEAQKEEMEENSTTSSGSIFKGEIETKGTWSLDKEADDLVFGEGGNVKFIVEKGNEMEEIDVTNADISSFKITDRNFVKTRFVASALGDTEAKVEILEEVYTSDRIKLYKFYPSTGALSDDKPEFAFQKQGQEYPISLESTMFLLWKKGVAKYFADCPDLAEMASEGGVEKSKEGLIKAARVYSELCEEVIKP